ncbi:hypothetical protein Hdeb2414_s0017g00505941 [Helianthus debilis subsp. tardiflorus]
MADLSFFAPLFTHILCYSWISGFINYRKEIYAVIDPVLRL